MAKHKEFNYLYLGKLGKLARPTKKNFVKLKLEFLFASSTLLPKYIYLNYLCSEL